MDAFIPFGRIGECCEHYHVPCCDSFIESRGLRESVRTAFLRKWLETAQRFIDRKPADLPFCRVVATVDIPAYGSSQIIIFYDKEYYEDFLDRSGCGQEWNRLDTKRSFKKERAIECGLEERCYRCREMDAESGVVVYDGRMWVYGELP